MLHLFYEENKSGLSMDELQYGLFSQKKEFEPRLFTVSLDALVLHLRRALMCFH